MPEDKKIARMLIEEYILSWHNYYIIIVWATGSWNVVSHIWPTWPGIQLKSAAALRVLCSTGQKGARIILRRKTQRTACTDSPHRTVLNFRGMERPTGMFTAICRPFITHVVTVSLWGGLKCHSNRVGATGVVLFQYKFSPWLLWRPADFFYFSFLNLPLNFFSSKFFLKVHKIGSAILQEQKYFGQYEAYGF